MKPKDPVIDEQSDDTDVGRALPHKVFIVDDHPIVRQGLTQLIDQETDLEVCGQAADVVDAGQAVCRSAAAVAVVDLSLGHTSGLRLIEELKVSCPQVQVLVLSMHDELRYAERCLAAGARGYVMKQETPGTVIAALRKILAGGIYVSESLQERLLSRRVDGEREIRASPVERLTCRELETFELMSRGMATKEIAAALDLSVKTVETHIGNIKKKLHLTSTREVLTYAVRWQESERGQG